MYTDTNKYLYETSSNNFYFKLPLCLSEGKLEQHMVDKTLKHTTPCYI